MSSKISSNLIVESSLQCYFFDLLHDLNRKTGRPLPKETIFYSSLVMDKFGVSQELFVEKEGKITEKILGLKLLESAHLSKSMRKRELKDIGDTALFICGYFSDSFNKKLVDTRYYQEIGQTAYMKLNNLVPSFYDIDYFYKDLSDKFASVTLLIDLLSKDISSNKKEDEILWIA
jgi:hypothetical protein